MFDVHRPYETMMELLRLAAVPESFHDELLDRHMGRDRLYHGVVHLATMWQIHRQWRPNVYFSRIDQRIASAIALHDAVYDARASDNETQSAALWRDHGQGDESQIAWVEQAILATKDHLAERSINTVDDRLREWFVGLDLAALAAPQHVFDLNNRLIRLEYLHVPDEEWPLSRAAYLQRFLDAPVIFQHTKLRGVFENPARDNLRRYLGAF